MFQYRCGREHCRGPSVDRCVKWLKSLGLYTSTRRVAADLQLSFLEIPPRDGSTVSVRVFDDHVRRDGDPFAPGEFKAGPVDAVSDILFRIGPVGFVAAQAAGLRRFLRSERTGQAEQALFESLRSS
jgi:hypothetical protein